MAYDPQVVDATIVSDNKKWSFRSGRFIERPQQMPFIL